MVDAGLMIGPRTFSSGDPLYAGNGFRNNDLTSLEVTEENIKRLSSYGVFTLKQYPLQPKREQHQWVAEVARKYGLNITAEGGGLEYDLGMAMDGQTGSEHPLGYAPLYSDATKFFGMAHFTYSPTAIVGGPGTCGNEEYFFQTFDYYKDAKLLRWTPWREILPHSRRRMMRPETDYSFPLIAQAVSDIRDAGGFGALGGHGQQQGIDSHWELWMYSSALGPMGALEMATNDGAHYLGMDQDLGSITVGKLADLDILNKNPLDDIHNSADIAFVMKGGILPDGTCSRPNLAQEHPLRRRLLDLPPSSLERRPAHELLGPSLKGFESFLWQQDGTHGKRPAPGILTRWVRGGGGGKKKKPPKPPLCPSRSRPTLPTRFSPATGCAITFGPWNVSRKMGQLRFS